MKKIFLTILIIGIFAVVSPVFAKTNNNLFWAAIVNLVQDASKEEMRGDGLFEEEEIDEDFVDPREIQQALREMGDMKRELKRFATMLKKMPNSAEDMNQINALLQDIAGYEQGIRSGIDVRSTIQEFRDAQIWETINRLRAKIEVPKEIKNWTKEAKRVETLLKQKSYQNLGLNLQAAKARIEEIKTGLVNVQQLYDSGDLESAIEALDEIRQEAHPGEIMGVLQRMRDLQQRMKRVKNQEARNQIQESLQEVIGAFNEGDFRTARELMDENFNDFIKIISAALMVGKKKGYTTENMRQMADKLDEKMKQKVEEKKMRIGEMEERKENMPQKEPQQFQQPQQQQPQQQTIKPNQPASGGGGSLAPNQTPSESPVQTPTQ